jgi:hypothetical protein
MVDFILYLKTADELGFRHCERSEAIHPRIEIATCGLPRRCAPRNDEH